MAERSIHELESNATAVAHKALALPLKAAIDVLNLATRLRLTTPRRRSSPKLHWSDFYFFSAFRTISGFA
jgi:hypothetical protein